MTGNNHVVEDMELRLRSTIQTIYFGKTKDIVGNLRQMLSVGILKQRKDLQTQIGCQIGNELTLFVTF